MKISVVIPTFNNLELLKRTIFCLENQLLPFSDFEVIVIDDGSSDGTREYLQSYDKPMQVRPLFNDINLGRSRSRNRGIFAARYELTVFLDADREVAVDFLKIHRDAQKQGPQVSIGRMKFHPNLPRSGINRYLEKRGAYRKIHRQNLPGRYFISCNSSLPTKILHDVGGFDENIVHYGGEDLELGHRLEKILPIRALPQALDYHNHTRNFDDFFDIVFGYGKYSLPYVLQKHPELRREIKLDNIPPQNPRDYFLAFLCSKSIYNVIKILGKLEIVPDICYSYLIFRNYRAGFLESLREITSENNNTD